jgi:hypothetical protein
MALDITDLRSTLQESLDGLNAQLTGRSACDKTWTKEIKSKLVSIGNKKKLSCYASGVAGVTSGEWLYDLCWLHYSDETNIGRIELAMESEWRLSFKEVRDDFVKLVQARARLRLMIWQSKNTGEFKNELDALIKQIHAFDDSQHGDAYLFSCWIAEGQRFTHHPYDHRAR